MSTGKRCKQAVNIVALVLGFALFAGSPIAAELDSDSEEMVPKFLSILIGDRAAEEEALGAIRANWQEGYVPMILETFNFVRDPVTAKHLVELLHEKTGQNHGYDLNKWYEWLWNQEFQPYPHYADFKGLLYSAIDPKFASYFNDERTAEIRLDEVRWGGVRQDGIPPLRFPEMVTAAEAGYLADDNVVFGLQVNRDARAYPKRIMAWHEMFVDEVGGVPVCGVYCTLCGSMILYESDHNGVDHTLGTSGFLYRSNKLMYDQATQSLWNTLWGTPVIGPLADEDITLERLSIVTTTWGEWRRRHPETKVLSLNTGHRRDYSEGAAYREYFATDELMFNVPALDTRLLNKEEVLGLIFAQHPDQPLAIAAKFLADRTVYHDKIGDLRFVVLTDRSGANRVYESKDVTFKEWDHDRSVFDDTNVSWTLSETELKSSEGRVLHRLPAHRAFWFGWYSAYSHTRLVQ